EGTMNPPFEKRRPLSATSPEDEADESVRQLYFRLGLTNTDASSSCEINWGEFEHLLFGPGDPDATNYLVQRALFLLGDPRVPVGLDAEELASETLRAAYGTTETALSHDVTRAEQLACLEKIQDRLLVDSLRTWNVPPGEVHSAQQETAPWQALP